ncbi:hypothetical protein VB636_22485, partial [Paracoccus sp. APAP_BH8]|uniref:hypothetical protein n=1 Tax=Paracoccus sp. APAP_BH8 TaxID=3110237 RepID=UPI002FD7EF31
YTLFAGKRVNVPNYWNEHADTLEWTPPSPPSGPERRGPGEALALPPHAGGRGMNTLAGRV